jgi:hypothetical protein
MERDRSEDPELDGRMSLKYYMDLTDIGWNSMYYINLAEDRVKW